jgi:hypothetical protein
MVELPEGFSMAPDGQGTVYTPGEDAARDREYFFTHRAHCERTSVLFVLPLIATAVVAAGWGAYDGQWLAIVLMLAAVPLLPWPLAKNLMVMLPFTRLLRILPFWFAPLFRIAAAAVLVSNGSIVPAVLIALNAVLIVLRELVGRRDARSMGLLV